jgi:hypothetical protein
VTALALVLVAAVVAGAATSRVTATVGASTAAVERLQARHLAEEVIEVALAELAHGRLNAALLAGMPLDATVVLDADRGDSEVSRVGSAAADIVLIEPRAELTIAATAEVGRAVHHASMVIRPHLSIEHAWVTEHESIDPALLRLPRAACAWDRDDARRAPGCVGARIGPGRIDGPVHSNDAIVLGSGASLAGSVSTAHLTRHVSGDLAPTAVAIPPGGSPVAAAHFRPHLALPRDVSDVLAGVGVTCRFRGPTLIRLDGSRIRVKSPRSIPRADDPLDPDRAIGCLDVDRWLLADVVTLDLPPHAVIEVVRDPLHDCVGHPLGIEQGEDSERDWWCSGGDVFLWGRYRGTRSVVAQDSAQIVWDLEPGDASGAIEPSATDLLGIVAGDSIVLRRIVGRPVRGSAPFGRDLAFAGPGIAPFGPYPLDAPTPVASTWDAPRIVAALAALRGSITVQNPFRGELRPGPLRIEGSLAGRFSGVLAWEEVGSTGAVLGRMGYPIEIRYDPRFARRSPPAMPVTDPGRIRILERDLG